jgi:hypothetical protein
MVKKMKRAASVKRTATVKRGTAVKRTSKVVPLKRTQNLVDKRLKIFDELDFEVFSGQKWDRLPESHSADIIVTWPDGHETMGIEKHIDDLKAMFAFAPDTSIKVHPIRFGSGDFTCVTGVMTGSFTRPMPTVRERRSLPRAGPSS